MELETRNADLRKLIDQFCDDFESAQQKGERPVIEEELRRAPSEVREALLIEMLVLELEWDARRGKSPNIETYIQRFPTDIAAVHQAFNDFRAWALASDLVSPRIKSKIGASHHDTDTLKAETVSIGDNSPSLELLNRGNSQQPKTEPPEKIGRYELVQVLGSGGMGTVYLAYDEALDRLVALKMPRFEDPKGGEARVRFRREARAMATVRHPNLCPIYDVGEFDGHPFITMAYINGRSLADQLAECGPMPMPAAAALVHQLALALHAVHEAGILHRDLKPSNVLIDENHEPFLTDFGLATHSQSEEELTKSGTLIGTPAYMAPEQVRGDKQTFGPHTDIYGLGAIFYQLLTGRQPYQRTALEVMGQLAAENPPEPPSAFVDLGTQAEKVCLQAMALEPKKRYRTAAEFAAALEPLCQKSERSVGARSAAVRVVATVLLIATAVAAGAMATLYYYSDRTPVRSGSVANNSSEESGSQSAGIAERSEKAPSVESVASSSTRAATDEPVAEEVTVEPVEEMTTLANGWKISHPVNLGPPVNTEFDEASPTIGGDGPTLIFYSNRGSNHQLWIANRSQSGEFWTAPRALAWPVDKRGDPTPHLSADGLTLLFSVDLPDGEGETDLWQCRRTSTQEPWSQPTSVGSIVNSEFGEVSPALSADGRTLVFASNRPGGQGGSDLWGATRTSRSEAWSVPVNLGPVVNGPSGDGAPALSSDGLVLAFEARRPDSHGLGDLYICTRDSPAVAWSEPVNLGPEVNTPTWDAGPAFGEQDSILYFSRRQQIKGQDSYGQKDIWKVRLERPASVQRRRARPTDH